MKLTGRYSIYGYEVLGEDGEAVYVAGNNTYESQSYIDPSHPHAMTLRELRSACIYSVKQECEEHGHTYGGVERDDSVLNAEED